MLPAQLVARVLDLRGRAPQAPIPVFPLTLQLSAEHYTETGAEIQVAASSP